MRALIAQAGVQKRFQASVIPDDVIRSIVGRLAFKWGERGEQRTVEILRSNGWLCSRMRKGPTDVVAGKDSRVLLIQVKSGERARIRQSEFVQMLKWGQAFNADTGVWHYGDRGRVERRRIRAHVEPRRQ